MDKRVAEAAVCLRDTPAGVLQQEAGVGAAAGEEEAPPSSVLKFPVRPPDLVVVAPRVDPLTGEADAVR